MHHLAYLAGVLHGDGWCTSLTLGLRSNDRDFSEAFTASVNTTFNLTLQSKQDERGYWLVRTSNKRGIFTHIRDFEPSTDEERASWVRGMFDSEGNALCRLNGVSINSYGRRVSFYSTNQQTLERTARYLDILALPTILRPYGSSEGHKGQKPVLELSLRGGRENYARFAAIVGSSIGRKQRTLDALPLSYRPEGGEYLRQAQLLGAAAKNAKRVNVVLPAVLEAMRSLQLHGLKPTQAQCAGIKGYHSLLEYYRHTELLTML